MSISGSHKRLTLADVMLIAALAVLCIYGFSYAEKKFPAGSEVQIFVNNSLSYTLPITIDRQIHVNGPIGDTVIEIKNSSVRVSDSPCSNKVCIEHGWIRRGAVVCLPNRVLVLIKSKSDGIDAVTG
ncbi:MAG: NusG domain II-containing protein [Nitrospiraceae bacterium]|nr:NusG domain II-containing protein [Nitrospiraceae bacterium]